MRAGRTGIRQHDDDPSTVGTGAGGTAIRGAVATAAATIALTALATQRLTVAAAALALVVVATLVTAGRWFGAPAVAAAGLLGLATLVAVGPGRTAGPTVLLVWVVAVWAVTLRTAAALPGSATSVDRAAPGQVRPRDARTRLRLAAGDLGAAVGGLVLVPLVVGTDEVAAGWAVGGAVAVVALLLVSSVPGRAGGDG